MEKKEIQEQRMRGYFIQATKQILKGEGIRSVNVRNIADHAGYSYATLYNYFKDVKDLVFECVVDFQEECAEFVAAETKNSPRGIEKIKSIAKSYMKYFVQYPGIFDIFFLERINEISNKRSNVELIYTLLDRLSADEWDYCVDNNIVSAETAVIVKDQIHYVVTGILLFYMNRRHPDSYDKFMELSEIQLDTIFSGLHCL